MIRDIHEEVLSWFPEIQENIKNLFEQGFHQGEKKDFRDLVSDIDLAVEELIIEKINALKGEQTILAEESHSDTLEVNADRLWCIDPIDGTANMLKQRQDYAVMIAYFEKGEAKLAYIYDVEADDLFHAVSGEGAYLNGRPLDRVSLKLNDSLISIDPQKYLNHPVLKALARQSFQIRYLGSSSADSARVIEGKFGATFCPACGPWDRAPLILFAQELGLRLSRVDGSPTSLVGTEDYYFGSQAIFEEVQNRISK